MRDGYQNNAGETIINLLQCKSDVGYGVRINEFKSLKEVFEDAVERTNVQYSIKRSCVAWKKSTRA